jgi:cell division protein ZipA
MGPDDEPDPEPFSARDDFDILLDGYEEERAQRMEELENRQDTASRRFMQWAGERVGRAGGLLRSGPGTPSASRSDKAARHKEPRVAEQASQEQSELDLFGPDRSGTGQAAADNSDDSGRQKRRQAARREEPAEPRQEEAAPGTNNNVDPEYSEVLVINVMAPPDQMIHGDELLPVLLGAGLRFGDMNIFHRHAQGKSGPVLFSVANVLNPGTFDLNEMHEFATRGLCFFLTLPNAINNMQAFEHMLQTARQVCDALDAELKDDYRSVMTAQTIEHYRERIRAFQLRQLRQEAGRK